VTREQIAAVARERDAAREAYREARDLRDKASDAATDSLAEHRRALEALEEARAAARASLWRHRGFTDARAAAKRRCDDAWRTYRELDRRAREAVGTLRGPERSISGLDEAEAEILTLSEEKL